MNTTIIALVLVTSQGATEIAAFDNEKDCMRAKVQITHSESFCYKRRPVKHEDAINEMTNVLIQMSKSLKNATKEMKDDTQTNH